ncbi:MAG: hypothetical protein DWQ36_09325 [Acidobacteria bacterium]|nr:MAG: hypothetical protein DWQ30_22570 [Acidobacteriota bacterium]REK08597.1 MAG: hypothetical protein DWQ36_09325 [Acidobacteriota bacterium]
MIAQETESQPEVSVAVPPDAEQIAAAVLAAPEDRRAEATVIGWRADGSNVTLREGSNDIVCLADDPRDAALNIACYHRDLEPYMARGRQLSFEGVQGKERSDRRFAEIEAGELPMPAGPRALYVTTGRRYDPEKGEIEGAHTRWVLYVPGATAEELGLPAGPTGGVAPWLMGEGTPGAHIMITPPRDGSP